jgi:RNA polymerase sigma-70 factor (ECF subfamily)
MGLSNEEWSALSAALRAFVGRRVRDRHAAEDVAQDVLAKAHAGPASGMDAPQARAWAVAVARNAVADHYRARRNGQMAPLDWEPAAGEASPPPGAAPAASGCLPHLVRRLSRRYRDAVEMSDLHGLPQRAVAERLGLSLPGAKSRVQRARAQLRDMLLDCCDIELDGRGGVLSMEPTPRTAGYCGGAARDSETGGFCIPAGPRPFERA